MEIYQCEICGKKHDIFKAIEVPAPEKILEIPDSEFEKRVNKIQNSYIIDDNIFLLEGDLFIYKERSKEPFFNWSVWASISLDDFKSKGEELLQGNNVEFDGVLETKLPFYEKSKGLKLKAIVNINYDYAVFKISEESQLKKDQTKDITDARVIEIMQMVYHNPENQNRNFDKPFSTILKENIELVEKEYLSQGKGFIIDFSSNQVLVQIVNNNMLETKNNIDGFGIQIAFDHTFESTKEEFYKFKNSDFAIEFQCHKLDGVTACQIDLGMNINKLKELIPKLIIDVFEENIDQIQIESFEN